MLSKVKKNYHLSDYHENGYTVIKNCIPHYWTDRIFVVVEKMLKQYDNTLTSNDKYESFNDPKFIKSIT